MYVINVLLYVVWMKVGTEGGILSMTHGYMTHDTNHNVSV